MLTWCFYYKYRLLWLPSFFPYLPILSFWALKQNTFTLFLRLWSRISRRNKKVARHRIGWRYKRKLLYYNKNRLVNTSKIPVTNLVSKVLLVLQTNSFIVKKGIYNCRIYGWKDRFITRVIFLKIKCTVYTNNKHNTLKKKKHHCLNIYKTWIVQLYMEQFHFIIALSYLQRCDGKVIDVLRQG